MYAFSLSLLGPSATIEIYTNLPEKGLRMDTAAAHYEYFLRMGSGSITITLHFAGDGTASIDYIARWMGQGEEAYRLSCLHQPLTDYHGFLRVLTIAQACSGTIFQESDIDYGDDIYGLHISDDMRPEQEIVYEYLILSQPAWHFSGDRVLDDIRLTTGAEWNDTFTLFLFLSDLTRLPQSSEVEAVARQLNHTKFIGVGDERSPEGDDENQ
jgi:hypothetical protein